MSVLCERTDVEQFPDPAPDFGDVSPVADRTQLQSAAQLPVLGDLFAYDGKQLGVV
ncbi:hypothetical protein [Streptomyces sp. NPDC020742]|uniref:hypothetical protein n=1 Tax=Streptomyces sp. NPDC020742 TaxID=3154897 RepID=UPI003400065E